MQAMTNQEIMRVAPAVFSEAPAPFMSEKYGFISTSIALDIMRGEGYQVVKAQQTNARRRDPSYVQHALTLRHEDSLMQESVVGEYVPQILLINSHNGRTQMSMRAGLFRFICSNGMVVGDTTMQEMIRHTKNLTDQILERIKRMAELSVPLAKKIEHWKTIELTEGQAETFAQKAAELRFGAARAGSFLPATILEARRTEDEGRTLWSVFNRVQENTTSRSLEGRNANNRVVRSAALAGIVENTAFNERLWALADAFAA